MSFCVYCGADDPATRDHVPPKSLFSEPRPSDLVTVPCCEACRIGQSAEDEYFRDMLAIRARLAGHPDIEQIRPKAHRGLTRPERRRFTRRLLKSARAVELRSPRGLSLGTGYTYPVDLDRLCRVVTRTVRGLYWKETGRRLPSTVEVVSYAIEGFADLDTEGANALKTLASIAHAQQHGGSIGEGVFSYRFGFASDTAASTVWLTTFYEAVYFVTATLGEPKLHDFTAEDLDI